MSVRNWMIGLGVVAIAGCGTAVMPQRPTFHELEVQPQGGGCPPAPSEEPTPAPAPSTTTQPGGELS